MIFELSSLLDPFRYKKYIRNTFEILYKSREIIDNLTLLYNKYDDILI